MTKRFLIAALLASALSQPVLSDRPVKDANGTNFNTCTTLISTTDITCHQLKNAAGTTIDPATSQLQTTANTSLGTIATNTTGLATATAQATGNTSLSTIATNTAGLATAAGQTAGNSNLGTAADGAWSGTGSGSLISVAKAIALGAQDTTPSTVILGAGTAAAGTFDLGNGSLVVTGDQAYTAGTRQPLNLTSTGRLKVGLSSAALIGATAATTADLAGFIDPSGNQAAGKTDTAGNLKVADSANAPFSGAVALVVGTAVSGANIGRSIAMVCTGTGNVSLTFTDASTLTVPITAAGLTILPFSVTTVNTSGTTATCAYANLK